MVVADLHIVMVVSVLEVLRSMRMVMAVGHDPVEKLRTSTIQLSRGAALVFVRVRPRVEVKIIVQFAVGASERNRTEFTAERTVIDVRRPPEIAAAVDHAYPMVAAAPIACGILPEANAQQRRGIYGWIHSTVHTPRPGLSGARVSLEIRRRSAADPLQSGPERFVRAASGTAHDQ